MITCVTLWDGSEDSPKKSCNDDVILFIFHINES